MRADRLTDELIPCAAQGGLVSAETNGSSNLQQQALSEVARWSENGLSRQSHSTRAVALTLGSPRLTAVIAYAQRSSRAWSAAGGSFILRWSVPPLGNASALSEASRGGHVSLAAYLRAMTSGSNMAEISALIGDPGRANMLVALLSGRALTATELAAAAGVSRPTASEHLAKLTQSHLTSVIRQGRHRYYSLASGQVARMLETIMAVSANRDEELPRKARRIDPALCEARTCYDHLAGRLGVSLADALIEKHVIVLSAEAGEITNRGRDFLQNFGLAVEGARPAKRLLCRPCLDWSERRPHLAGRLGAALQERLFGLGWLERSSGRAVVVTSVGRLGLSQTFGLDF